MKRRVQILLAIGGMVVVAVLIRRVGVAALGEMLQRLRWSFLLICMVHLAQLGVRSVTLWRTSDGTPVRFVDVLRIRLSAEAVEVLTSTGPFLAEPSKAWLLTRAGLSASEAFAAVVAEYLLYTTVSAGFVVAAAALLVTFRASFSLVPLALIATAFIAAVAFASATGIGLIVPIVRLSSRIIGRTRATELATVIEPVEVGLLRFLHARPRRLVEVIALEIVAHGLLLAEVWILLGALRLPFTWVAPVIVEGGSKSIAFMFFYIPGQLGAFESVYMALFGLIGLPTAAGLTLAFVRRARSLLTAAVCLAAVAALGGAPKAEHVTR